MYALLVLLYGIGPRAHTAPKSARGREEVHAFSSAQKGHIVKQTARELVTFFALAYGFSWSVWLLARSLLDAQGVFELGPFLLLGSFGPSLSALVVAALYGGRGAPLALLKKLLVWRVNWKVYLLTFLGVPVLFLLSLLALGVRPLGATSLAPFAATLILAMPLNAALEGLFGVGPLGEELGWRGFALPRLLERYGDVQASAVLGLVWAFWHLPLFAFADWRGDVGFVAFGLTYPLTLVALSYALTKLWRWSRGSVLIAVLFHAVVNFSAAQLLDPARFSLGGYGPNGVVLVSLILFAVLAAFFWALSRTVFSEQEGDKPFAGRAHQVER